MLPVLETEARAVITGLLPYLRATYPTHPQVDRFFSPVAIERARDVRWDTQIRGLLTPDDHFIQLLLDEPDEFTISDPTSTETTTTSAMGPQPDGHGLRRNLLDGDSDSVSTLQRSSAGRSSQPGTKRPASAPNPSLLADPAHSSPPASTVSSLTVEERLSSLELKLDRSLATMLAHLTRLTDVSGSPNTPRQAGNLRGHA